VPTRINVHLTVDFVIADSPAALLGDIPRTIEGRRAALTT
jgi:hypothetical protein